MKKRFQPKLMQAKQALLLLLALGWLLSSGGPLWADEIAMTQMVQAGETAHFTIEVRNQSAADHAYTPALTGLPDTASITFHAGEAILESLTVAAGGSSLVVGRVTPSVSTPVGSYAGEFTLTRDDGETVRLPITLVVEKTFALEIVSRQVNLSTFSGQSFTFDLSATNTGAATVNHVALQVGTPAKWIVQTEPSQVDALEPGAEAAFQVEVAVPPSQVAMDQPLTVMVVADEISSPESKVTVRVQKSPSFLLAAGGIIAVAVVGVLAYFRANGRR
jgi:uncharacterized membrane protein